MKEGDELKSVLKYPGAKNRLATWICGYIPKHDVYLEPFAGSLAVLLNKQRSHIETVNDIDEEIVNFFRILRDRSGELERVIEFTISHMRYRLEFLQQCLECHSFYTWRERSGDDAYEKKKNSSFCVRDRIIFLCHPLGTLLGQL